MTRFNAARIVGEQQVAHIIKMKNLTFDLKIH